MNFSAISVVVDSELVLDRNVIIENVKLSVSNLSSGLANQEPSPVIELSAQLSKDLKQDPPTFN